MLNHLKYLTEAQSIELNEYHTPSPCNWAHDFEVQCIT